MCRSRLDTRPHLLGLFSCRVSQSFFQVGAIGYTIQIQTLKKIRTLKLFSTSSWKVSAGKLEYRLCTPFNYVYSPFKPEVKGLIWFINIYLGVFNFVYLVPSICRAQRYRLSIFYFYTRFIKLFTYKITIRK